MCTTDRTVTERAVQNLIDHIQGNNTQRPRIPSLAEVMAVRFRIAANTPWTIRAGIGRVRGHPTRWEPVSVGRLGPVADSAIAFRNPNSQAVYPNASGEWPMSNKLPSVPDW